MPVILRVIARLHLRCQFRITRGLKKPETLRVQSCRCYAFGCKCEIVAIGGGHRMARGWRCTKLSLSSALLLSFSGLCFVLLFLSFCFCFCSHALIGALSTTARLPSIRLFKTMVNYANKSFILEARRLAVEAAQKLAGLLDLVYLFSRCLGLFFWQNHRNLQPV